MEKNSIKQFFRSGNRPTQEHFYALIDACYNTNFTAYVSGYEMKTETGQNSPVKSISYEAGKLILVPWFRRINIPLRRTYHYALPSCNMGPEMRLQRISMELRLPGNSTYEVRDKKGLVKIDQQVEFNSINVYNGSKAFLTLSSKEIPSGENKEFSLDRTFESWKGISVDIVVDYDINSNIAVSDQFDITDSHAEELIHVFGGVGIEFRTNSK